MADQVIPRQKPKVTRAQRLEWIRLGVKPCTKCSEIKPTSEFNAENRNKSGLSASCKLCISAYFAEYYSKSRDSIFAKRSAPELKKARVEKRLANLDENRARERALRSIRRTYSDIGPKKTTVELKNDIARIIELQGGKCAALHCREDVTKKNHVDHIIPVRLGGTNDSCNLQVLCPKCNMSKGGKHPNKWRPTIWWFSEIRC